MLKSFSISDTGRRRDINQDCEYSSQMPVGNLPNVFVVADGMGGENAGDLASRLAVDTFVAHVKQCRKTEPDEILREAAEASNGEVYARSLTESDLSGMGTTMVAASFDGRTLHVINIGDSRLYVIGEHITQITRDHSLVEEMVRMGMLTQEAARVHPDRRKITRAIGVEPVVRVDVFEVELSCGQFVLLCTDGLTNMVEDEEIRRIVLAGRDVVESTQNLIDAANNAGGRDNVTALLIEVCDDGHATARGARS